MMHKPNVPGFRDNGQKHTFLCPLNVRVKVVSTDRPFFEFFLIYKGEPDTFFPGDDMLYPYQRLLPLVVALFYSSATSVVCGFVPYWGHKVQICIWPQF